MSIDDIIDLDAQLETQYGLGPRIESMPLHTERVNDVALTIIRVTVDGKTRHQLYAVDTERWALTGMFGNYTDALAEFLRWRRYVERGGTIAAWLLTHEAVQPERSGF